MMENNKIVPWSLNLLFKRKPNFILITRATFLVLTSVRK